MDKANPSIPREFNPTEEQLTAMNRKQGSSLRANRELCFQNWVRHSILQRHLDDGLRPRWPRGYRRPHRKLDIRASKCQPMVVLQVKYEKLQALLRSYESCLVAYSGGVDSVFLAYVAAQVLKERSLAAIADSPSLPRSELDEALAIADTFQIPVRVLHTQEFNNPEYLANPNNRCYFCKHELFTELAPLAEQEGFAVIAYGENASDSGDFRPGAKAAAQFSVRAPLKEIGLTKTEIRELSASLGLPTSDKPQMACLSSRIPYGEPVSIQKLGMIEQAEKCIRGLGFHDVRVRHHELKIGSLARIEIGAEELGRFWADQCFAPIAKELKEIGYTHVTVDLDGYRRGSLNGMSLPKIPIPLPQTANR